MSKHTISATELSRDLSRILNKVHYQGQDFEITRGKEIIARIIPAEPHQRKVTINQLQELLANLPPLEQNDRQDFLKDINAIRSKIAQEENPWD
jgi:antitoxin (DNA-binding transcriptional repressor) of toxin-antitoxin stability system